MTTDNIVPNKDSTVQDRGTSTVLNRMFEIVDRVEGAKWFPPTAFNVTAWAAACKTSETTVRKWVSRIDGDIVRCPSGREIFLSVEDFWYALETFSGSNDGEA